jgi:hypothetical protein
MRPLTLLTVLLFGCQTSPAVKKDTIWDYAANIVALWGLSTPNFWLGIMLILLVSVNLGWLPASGFVSPFEDLAANLKSMIMPAFVLGNAIAAVLMRHTRSAMLQVLNADYVRTARAKGLEERVVVLKHALRNALIPIVTLGALEFGTLFSGAVLTEQVFSIPGFGKLIVDAVFNRDYAVVQGVVLFTAPPTWPEPARGPGLFCQSADAGGSVSMPARVVGGGAPGAGGAAPARSPTLAPRAAGMAAARRHGRAGVRGLSSHWRCWRLVSPQDVATSWTLVRKG